jgi:ribosomal protein S18 acetylase RimI-like enzyme
VLDADFRNLGALKLYESLGFSVFNQKSSKILDPERGMYNLEYIL